MFIHIDIFPDMFGSMHVLQWGGYCCANKAHGGGGGGALFDNWHASYEANIRHSAVSCPTIYLHISKISKIIPKVFYPNNFRHHWNSPL